MKIAIVGVGVIGRVHLKALLQRGTPPTAICDIDEGRARAVAAEFSLDAEIFTDYGALLDAAPEVVHICTPHHLHADMVVAALARDIHVLCEKPLCIRASDIPRIERAERESRALLGVCHQNRYNPANRFVKNYLKDKHVLAASATVAWHRDAKYYNAAAWRGKWATEGGGVMINQALHTLDLMQWFLGFPETVTATTCNLSLGDVIEVEDTAVATFGGNQPFTFFATNAGAVSMPVQITLRTDSEEILLLPHSVHIDGQTVLHQPQNVVLGKACYGDGHPHLIADFYRAVKTGERFAIDGREGAAVIKLILAMYESKGACLKL